MQGRRENYSRSLWSDNDARLSTNQSHKVEPNKKIAAEAMNFVTEMEAEPTGGHSLNSDENIRQPVNR